MIRFLGRMTAFVSLQMLVAAVVIWQGSPQDSNHYLSALQDKIARLEQCPGNRLLVAGGSNVAFGIHSQRIEESTGVETINLGLHAALGLEFSLECVRQHCRAGDVVVLTPEYELLISDLQQGEEITINQMLAQWPEAVRYTNKTRDTSWKRFLDHDALWQTHEWVARAYARVTHRTKEGRIYERASFNEYGDVVAHYGCPTPGAIDTSPLEEVDPKRLEQAIEILNQFSRQCGDRGVAVYLTFPPLPEEKYAASIDVIRHIARTLETELDIPVLHRPDECTFPLHDFFDSSYHLTRAAGEQRSRAIGDAVQQLQSQQAHVAALPEAGEPKYLLPSRHVTNGRKTRVSNVAGVTRLQEQAAGLPEFWRIQLH
jgi:hypothetical protein